MTTLNTAPIALDIPPIGYGCFPQAVSSALNKRGLLLLSLKHVEPAHIYAPDILYRFAIEHELADYFSAYNPAAFKIDPHSKYKSLYASIFQPEVEAVMKEAGFSHLLLKSGLSEVIEILRSDKCLVLIEVDVIRLRALYLSKGWKTPVSNRSHWVVLSDYDAISETVNLTDSLFGVDGTILFTDIVPAITALPSISLYTCCNQVRILDQEAMLLLLVDNFTNTIKKKNELNVHGVIYQGGEQALLEISHNCPEILSRFHALFAEYSPQFFFICVSNHQIPIAQCISVIRIVQANYP